MNTIQIERPKVHNIDEVHTLLHKTFLATYSNSELNITEALIKELIPEAFDDAKLEQQKERIIHPPKNSFYVIAKIDEIIVGVCFAVQKEEHVHLRSMYVLPEYQRRGVGKALWNALFKWSDKKKPIVVHVATYNENAIRFYKSLGFVDTGKRFTEERHVLSNGISIPELEMKLDPK